MLQHRRHIGAGHIHLDRRRRAVRWIEILPKPAELLPRDLHDVEIDRAVARQRKHGDLDAARAVHAVLVRADAGRVGHSDVAARQLPTVLLEQLEDVEETRESAPRPCLVDDARLGQRFARRLPDLAAHRLKRRAITHHLEDLFSRERELQSCLGGSVAVDITPGVDARDLERILKHERPATAAEAVVRARLDKRRLALGAAHARHKTIEQAVRRKTRGVVIAVGREIERARRDMTKRDHARADVDVGGRRDRERLDADPLELRAEHLDAHGREIEVAAIERALLHLDEPRMHAELARRNRRHAEEHAPVGRAAEDRVDLARALDHMEVRDEPELPLVLDDEAGAGPEFGRDLRHRHLVRGPVDGRRLRTEVAHEEEPADDQDGKRERHDPESTDQARRAAVALPLSRDFGGRLRVDRGAVRLVEHPRIKRARLLADRERGPGDRLRRRRLCARRRAVRLRWRWPARAVVQRSTTAACDRLAGHCARSQVLMAAVVAVGGHGFVPCPPASLLAWSLST